MSASLTSLIEQQQIVLLGFGAQSKVWDIFSTESVSSVMNTDIGLLLTVIKSADKYNQNAHVDETSVSRSHKPTERGSNKIFSAACGNLAQGNCGKFESSRGVNRRRTPRYGPACLFASFTRFAAFYSSTVLNPD